MRPFQKSYIQLFLRKNAALGNTLSTEMVCKRRKLP